MRSLPKGVHATFITTCHVCGEERTVTNGKPDPHQCRVDLD